LLILLVERWPDLVPRSDIADRLWGRDVFIDVDTSVNTAVRKVRRALGDSSAHPEYVIRVPGKGYRFGAAVEREPVPRLARLAVLPFENLTGDPGREYLADGFTEEAIAVLGQIDPERLVVVGRTSVMPYKRSTAAIPDIARELDAAYLLESSVRAEGARIRVTSRLISASDQVQLWSGAWDGEPASMIEFERELCAVLAAQIRVRIGPGRIDALERRHTRDPQAYNLYLQGRYFWNQLTAETTRQAVECFVRATTRDPDYALAWSGIADAHAASPISGDTPPLAVEPLAVMAAGRAVAADPGLAAAQTSMGSVHFFITFRWAESERHHRRALELDPHYAHGHRMLAVLLSSLLRHDEALAEIRHARELDPLYVMHQSLSSQIAFSARQFELAVQFARRAIAIDPAFWIARLHLAQALIELGEHPEALEALDVAARLAGNSKILSHRGYVFARSGHHEEACAVLRTLEDVGKERYVPPYASALVHLALGEHDAAFAALERAFAVRDVHLLFLTTDPKWDPVREDARFARIIDRCGFNRQA
jgi:TolB-like protein/tetratricopeptide (TPR) repeat protein